MKQHLLTKVDIDAETEPQQATPFGVPVVQGSVPSTVGLLWGLKALVDFLCSLG